MAEMTGYEYSDIIVRAILPAFLYFLGIFLGVHFKAKKLGLVGSSVRNCPSGSSCCRKSICSCP